MIDATVCKKCGFEAMDALPWRLVDGPVETVVCAVCYGKPWLQSPARPEWNMATRAADKGGGRP
jgi:hypothetical protein